MQLNKYCYFFLIILLWHVLLPCLSQINKYVLGYHVNTLFVTGKNVTQSTNIRTLHGHRIYRAYTTNKGNLCLEVLICTVPLLDFNETLDEFYYACKLKGHYFHSSHSNSFLCKRTRWRIEFFMNIEWSWK